VLPILPQCAAPQRRQAGQKKNFIHLDALQAVSNPQDDNYVSLGTVRSFSTWAYEEGYLETNVFASMKLPKLPNTNPRTTFSDIPMPITLWAESAEKATIWHLVTWEECNGERKNVRTG
jgi:site-specific recombinase XerD